MNVKNVLDNENTEKSSGQEGMPGIACYLTSETGYVGLIIRHGTLQHALLEWKIEDRSSRGRPSTMWMGNIPEWSGFGYVDATDGRHKTGTTGGNSLHRTHQSMESDDDENQLSHSHEFGHRSYLQLHSPYIAFKKVLIPYLIKPNKVIKYVFIHFSCLRLTLS